MGLTSAEWSALRLSLSVAAAAVALGLIPAIVLGYGMARRMRGRWLVETLVNLPLVLPPVVTGYLLLVLLGRRGPIGRLLEPLGIRIAFSWLGCVVAAAVISFPLMVRAIRLAFQGVDPRLEAASQTLGVGRIATFLRVSLPLGARGIVAGGALAFARSLGEFGATIMLAGNIAGRTQTIPLAIYSLVERPGGIEQSWRLVALSIALAIAALAVSEWMEHRHRRRAGEAR